MGLNSKPRVQKPIIIKTSQPSFTSSKYLLIWGVTALFFVYVVVNFLSQLIFIFLLFWGMVMYAYEFETKEKQKLTKIKN